MAIKPMFIPLEFFFTKCFMGKLLTDNVNQSKNLLRKLMNRIKFGLDSAMLGGLLAGTGGAIKAAAKRSGQLRKNNDVLDKVLEYVTPQGAKTREFFDVERLIGPLLITGTRISFTSTEFPVASLMNWKISSDFL